MTKAYWRKTGKARRQLIASLFWYGVAGLMFGCIIWWLGFNPGYSSRGHHPPSANLYETSIPLLIGFVAPIIVSLLIGYYDWKKERPTVWYRDCLETPREAVVAIVEVLRKKGMFCRTVLTPKEAKLFQPEKFKWAASVGSQGVVIKVTDSVEAVGRVYLGPETEENQATINGLKEHIDEALGVN